MSYSTIKQRLDAGMGLLLDGATGTELERRGVPMDSAAWCGPCNLDHADTVEDVHVAYIDAGASVITANTYAATRLMLEPAGMADRIADIVQAACDAAKRARDKAAGGRDILIAGSMSHMVPLAPGTDKVVREHEPDAATVRAAAEELVDLLTRGGCDLVILEMMYDRLRAPIMIETAVASDLPVWCGFSLRRADPEAAVYGFGYLDDVPHDELYAMLPAEGVDVAGIMHSYPDVVSPGLERLGEMYSGHRMAYPESGHFEMPRWNFEDVMTPAALVDYARDWRKQGTRIIGGCCGLGIEHIRALNAAGFI